MKRKLIYLLSMIIVLSPVSSVYASTNNFTETSSLSLENIYGSEEKNEDYSEIKKDIKEKAQILINNTNKPASSVQYAISKGDKIIISDTVGMSDKENGKYADSNTIYGIGSLSKLYTTVCVMQLVDERKVDLDLPVINYVKDFKMVDDRYKKITVRMLLNHSAGFQGTTQGDVSLREDDDNSGYNKFLSDLSEQTLKAEPGEYSAYSNDGFTLAQILVERVSGLSFTEYIHENITKPLGLSNTKTPEDDFNKEQIAKAYRNGGSKAKPIETFMEIGMGGIYSTAEDVCKFIHGITSKDKDSILSSRSSYEMANKEYLKGVWPTDAEDNIFAFGLGWDSVNLYPFNKYGIKALAKAGETLDYTSYVINLPDYDMTMTVTVSGGDFSDNLTFASTALLEVLKEDGIIKDILPNSFINDEKSQYMPQYLKEFSGLYMGKNQFYNIQINSDGTLGYMIYDGFESPLHHTYSGYFESDYGFVGIRFVKEKNGNVYMERKLYNTVDNLGQIACCDYIAQKVEPQQLSDNVKAAWEKRANKTYFTVNERYCSEYYDYGPGIYIGQPVSGYVNGQSKIIDENTSKAVLKLPTSEGSDVYDYNFYKKDNIEYVKVGGILYMGQEGVNYLDSNLNSVVIDDDGYTKWYTISKESQGKIMTIEAPEKSNVIIYNANGACISNMYEDKEKTITLKDGQYAAFVGAKGTEFKISIS